MSIGILLGCCLASAQAGDVKTVSIESSGLTIEQILTDVRKQTGLDVKAGNVAADRIVASVSGLPAKEFLEKLAWTANAEWQASGAGVKLERTPSQFAENRSRAYEARLASVKSALAAAKVNTKPVGFSDKDMAARIEQSIAQFKKQYSNYRGNEEDKMVNMSQGGNPATVILNEIVSKMTPKVLADLNPRHRTVFSTNPTRFQRPMPFAITTADDFLAARRALAAAAKKVRGMTQARVYTGVQGEDKVVDYVGKILVRTQGDGRRDYLSLDVLVGGPKGEIIGQASAYLPIRTTIGPTTKLPQVTIPLSAETQKLSRALAYGNRESGSMEYDVAYPSTSWKLDANCRPVEDILTDPVAHEPLGYAPTDIVKGAAAAMKKPVMAYISDAMYAKMIGFTLQKQLSLNTFIENTGTEIQNTDCLLIRPADLEEAVDSDCDRVKLKALIAKIRNVGYLRLSDLIAYRTGHTLAVNGSSLDYRWLNACSMVLSNQLAATSQEAINLIDAFGWKSEQLTNGSKLIPFASWPNVVKNQFDDLLESGRFRIYSGNQTELQMNEPTEVTDSQLAFTVQLRVTTQTNEIAYAIAPNEKTGRFLHPYQIGYRRNPILMSQMGQNQQFPTRFSSYRPAMLKSINMSFVLQTDTPSGTAANPVSLSGVTVQMTRQQYDFGAFGSLNDVVSISDKEVSEDELPESFKKAIQQNATARGPFYNPADHGYRPAIPP